MLRNAGLELPTDTAGASLLGNLSIKGYIYIYLDMYTYSVDYLRRTS